MTTAQGIRAQWVLAFDGRDHVVLENGVVVWDHGVITHVGRSVPAHVADIAELPGHLLMPGMICLHFHAGSQATGRLTLHQGRKDVFGGGFQNTIPRRGAERGPREDPAVAALAPLVELVLGGATTVLEAGSTGPVADALLAAREQIGLRLYLGPAFRSADLGTDDDGRIQYLWRDDQGLPALQEACRFLEAVPNNGMIQRVVYPSILDYCTADLLKESKTAADNLDAHLQIHACQSLYEFHEILHRTARTPIEWLADLGVLGPNTSLAHCFMTTANPLSAYRGGRDLEILAQSGASIVHCPVAVGRRGNALHWLDSHQAAGVRVAIGTDTFPRDMLNELRHAQFMAKLVSNDVTAGSARAVIRAATIDGADAIGRPDLGRIAVGKAADLVAINLRTLAIGPVRDPVDAALSGATARDITRVIVNGRTVAQDGVVPGVDVDRLLTTMQEDGERAWDALPGYHWTRRPADDVFPRSFRLAAANEFAD